MSLLLKWEFYKKKTFRIVLNLQKSCKTRTEFPPSRTPAPVPPLSASYVALLGHSSKLRSSTGTFVTTLVWTLQQNSILFRVHQFFPNVLFCSRISSRTSIAFSHVSLTSSGPWQFLRLSLFLMNLAVLRRTGQVIWGECSSVEICLGFFSWWCCFGGGETPRWGTLLAAPS